MTQAHVTPVDPNRRARINNNENRNRRRSSLLFLLHPTIQLLQAPDQLLADLCVLRLDRRHLLAIHLHPHFLRLVQVIENAIAPLSVDLQDLTDRRLFIGQLTRQSLHH